MQAVRSKQAYEPPTERYLEGQHVVYQMLQSHVYFGETAPSEAEKKQVSREAAEFAKKNFVGFPLPQSYGRGLDWSAG